MSHQRTHPKPKHQRTRPSPRSIWQVRRAHPLALVSDECLQRAASASRRGVRTALASTPSKRTSDSGC